MGPVLRVAAVLLLLALVLVAVVRLLENRIVYVPSRGCPPPPRGLAVEEVSFEAPDGTRLVGWYGAPAAGRGTVLVCHGNAGNLADRGEYAAMLLDRGLGVFLFDYRGYGRSEGRPSEEGLYADAAAAFDTLAARLGAAPGITAAPGVAAGGGVRPPEPIVVLGRSLGAAVAVELAHRRPVAGLILEGGFPSAPRLGRAMFPLLPLALLMRNRFDAASRIEGLPCPLLFFHGDRDTIVPIAMGRALFDRAREPKSFVTVPGAGHNDLPWVGGKAYLDRLEGFVNRCRGGS